LCNTLCLYKQMKKEVNEFVGRKALITCGSLKIEVEIVDVHNTYGKTRYEVRPVSGSGITRVEKVELLTGVII